MADIEIASLLCVRAGMIMEDVCAEAVATLPAGLEAQLTHIDKLIANANEAATLLQAAGVWLRSADQ